MFGVMSLETLNPKVSQSLWTRRGLHTGKVDRSCFHSLKILVTVQVPLPRTVTLFKCNPYSSRPKDP